MGSKVFAEPAQHNLRAKRGLEVKLHTFLTSAVDGNE
jgi:hypothetical protein